MHKTPLKNLQNPPSSWVMSMKEATKTTRLRRLSDKAADPKVEPQSLTNQDHTRSAHKILDPPPIPKEVATSYLQPSKLPLPHLATAKSASPSPSHLTSTTQPANSLTSWALIPTCILPALQYVPFNSSTIPFHQAVQPPEASSTHSKIPKNC